MAASHEPDDNNSPHPKPLSLAAMGEVDIPIDPAFIQEQQHRPKPSITQAQGIPLINLSPSISPTAKQSLISEIHQSCRNWGFFQVINHGVPLEKRQRLELAAKKFFCQSMEEKRKVKRDEKYPLGYYDTEHTKNVRDWKEVFDFTVMNPCLMPTSHEPDDYQVTQYCNRWPQYPPELREVLEDCVNEVQLLAYKLLGLIALSLGLEEARLHGFFKDETSRIRLNYYPPCPAPDLALGVGRHKDGGALTILAQDDLGGLEVKRKSDGAWIRVEPTPNAYIINVGDIIQVWSNDIYESVEHRAMVNYDRERLSIPFFFNPAHYTNVEPLEELIDDQNPAKYRPYNWGKFRASRVRSNFKKLNVENTQIYHFKVLGN